MQHSIISRVLTGALIVALAAFLSGCGGLHVVPDQNYSETGDPNTIRIVFDQDGNLYPKSPPSKMPEPGIYNWNSARTVDHEMCKLREPYSPELTEQLYQEYAAEIDAAMRRLKTNRVIFLIHGYNNRYSRARDEAFAGMKKAILDATQEDQVFVEVYWDGLYRGLFTAPVPAWYWFDSMSYSNIAGQRGLRTLLNRLPRDLDMVFMTHSRGAGVAFSAFADPLYDEHIYVPPYEPLKKDHFRSVTLAPIAPAIGSGHPLWQLKTVLPDDSRVVVGFNEKDWVLQKSIKDFGPGPDRFGDTGLGANDWHFRQLAKHLNADGREWLQRVEYQDYSSHDIEGYLDREPIGCLLWKTGLAKAAPPDCPVETEALPSGCEEKKKPADCKGSQ